MFALIVRRLIWMIPTLLVVSFISFVIIELPPGDYLTSHVAALQAAGDQVDPAEIERLRRQYGLDDPFLQRYASWLAGLSPVGWSFATAGPGAVVGYPVLKFPDMGTSFEYDEPVTALIGERLALTVIISLTTLLFTWAVAIPIGIYAAVNKYAWSDHFFTFLGFLGLAVPNFLLALLFMFAQSLLFGVSAGGLFSPAYQEAAWSFGKVLDMAPRLLVPVVVIGTAGTAGLIRVVRGNLLDELGKPYVVAARAKGVPPIRLLLKYPVRVALNPVISTIGWVLPMIVSGEAIVSIVLGLPTTGELLLNALMNQDMYLAGSMIMLLSLLTIVGTLVSDILLVILDPRIRYEGREA
ncbi:MAG: ABC transporter permease [Phycisphaeraceae bacterium]